MNDNRPKGGSPTMSWLVRCWEEPREVPHAEPVLRCFVRDLRTGEEKYLTDPREIGDLVLRQLRTACSSTRDEEGQGEREHG